LEDPPKSLNLRISVSDTNCFDKLVRQAQNIKFTIKNAERSRLRKGKEPELENDGREDPERLIR
jgi:hypothetical protein